MADPPTARTCSCCAPTTTAPSTAAAGPSTATRPRATFRRPDGRTAEPVPSPPGGTLAELVDANHRHGRDIALDGAGSNWLGDHIDWDCFFAAFNEGPSAPPLDWSPN